MASWNGDDECNSKGNRQLPDRWTSNPRNFVTTGDVSEGLPVLKFTGELCYHTTIADASIACVEIRKMVKNGRLILGFDTEWGPIRQPDAKYPPSVVVQMCADPSKCHVIQLSAMHGFPKELRSLIMDETVIKVGVGVKIDVKKLGKEQLWPEYEVSDVAARSTEELSKLANRVLHTRQQWSLRRLVQNLLKHDLPKDMSLRCGDWTKYPLSEEQLMYAALDA